MSTASTRATSGRRILCQCANSGALGRAHVPYGDSARCHVTQPPWALLPEAIDRPCETLLSMSRGLTSPNTAVWLLEDLSESSRGSLATTANQTTVSDRQVAFY